jgi:hypothetical protein
MRHARFGICALLAGVFALTPVYAAGVIVPNEDRFAPFSNVLPTCDDSGVLDRIRERFAEKESEYWNSGRTLGFADRVAQIGYRSNGVAYIPRRYCVARMQLDNGRRVQVDYQVQADLGIIGWGYGVEWCVVGFDRNLAYAPSCVVTRPIAQR